MKKAERKQEQAVKEAERLAKMSDEQRYVEELKRREDEIIAKERDLAVAENKASAAQILSERGISSKLVGLVVAEDADTMLENINLLDEAFKQSVKEEVEKRLSTSTPKKNLPLDNTITKQDLRR